MSVDMTWRFAKVPVEMIRIVSDHEENDVEDVQITRFKWKEVDDVDAWK